MMSTTERTRSQIPDGFQFTSSPFWPPYHLTSMLRMMSGRFALAALWLAAGCGKTETAAHAMNGSRHDVTVTATDYAFRGLPDSLPAGWVTFRLANTGREQHMLAVLAVPPELSQYALMDSLSHGHFPSDVPVGSGVNNVSPGDTAVVTVFLPADRYVVTCFVTSPDGHAHAAKGMGTYLVTFTSADSGSSRASDATVTLSRDSIGLSGDTTGSGKRNWSIVSKDSGWKDFEIVRLLPGKTLADAMNWLSQPNSGSPAAVALGGTAGTPPGRPAVVSANLPAGKYLLVLDAFDKSGHVTKTQRELTLR